MDPIKVVIIDDNISIRRVVKTLLEMEDNIDFCGEAETPEMGKALLSRSRPNIAIIDISLNGHDGGLKLLQEMTTLDLPTKAIVFSAHDEDIYADRIVKAGAKGYVCKNKIVESLVKAIHDVSSGESFFMNG